MDTDQARAHTVGKEWAPVVLAALVLMAGCTTDAVESAFPEPLSAWDPTMEEKPSDLPAYDTGGYMPDDWMPLDSLSGSVKDVGYDRFTWVVLAVPVEVGENVLVPATEDSSEFVYTPVEVRVVRVLLDATEAEHEAMVPGGHLTVAVLGGAAEGHFYPSALSLYDKDALAQGGLFALEVSDLQDYPGMGDEVALSRGFRLNGTDMTSLQLGHSGERDHGATVSTSVLTDIGVALSRSELQQLAAGTHPDVVAALADVDQ